MKHPFDFLANKPIENTSQSNITLRSDAAVDQDCSRFIIRGGSDALSPHSCSIINDEFDGGADFSYVIGRHMAEEFPHFIYSRSTFPTTNHIFLSHTLK